MYQSEQINEIANALSKAQADITPAIKESTNPFFKSKYADLSSVWGACREPLTKNGLAVLQTMEYKDSQMVLITTLTHSSGQWIRSCLPILPVKQDAQSIGSAITYMRRYSLAAMVGVIADDDDGNAATYEIPPKNKHYESKESKADLQSPTINKAQAKELEVLLSECSPKYQTNFWGYLKERFKIEDLEKIQLDSYKKIKDGILKNKEEVSNNFSNELAHV